jgi:hypothetical protein
MPKQTPPTFNAINMVRKKGMASSMTHQHIRPSIVSTHEQKIMNEFQKRRADKKYLQTETNKFKQTRKHP